MATAATDMLIGSWSSGVSVTTGTVNGTAFNTRNGSPTRGLRAVVHIDSYGVTTANSLSTILTPSIEVSANGSTGWRNVATGKTRTATTTNTAYTEDIGPFTVPSDEPYVRCVLTPTQAGGTAPVALVRVFLTDSRRTPAI
jgi:hypothetical protein